jgi:hypothetical protein
MCRGSGSFDAFTRSLPGKPSSDIPSHEDQETEAYPFLRFLLLLHALFLGRVVSLGRFLVRVLVDVKIGFEDVLLL